MSKKFHLKANGDPAPCTADIKACPRGGADDHFASADEARKAFETKHNTFIDEKKPANIQEIKETITQQDIDEAYEIVFNDPKMSVWSGPASWKTLMGDKRQTQKNINEYDRLRKEVIDNDPDLASSRDHYSRISAENNSYGRAYKAGVKIPKDIESELEARWTSGIGMGSKSYTEYRLKESEENLEKIKEGIMSPKKIIGRMSDYSNPKRAAEEYLTDQIQRNQESLATRGRSDVTNIRMAKAELQKKANILAAKRKENEEKHMKEAGERPYTEVPGYEDLQSYSIEELVEVHRGDSPYSIYDKKNDVWVGRAKLALVAKDAAAKSKKPEALAEQARETGIPMRANVKNISHDEHTSNGNYVAVDMETGEYYDPSNLVIGDVEFTGDLDYYEILDNTDGSRDKWIANSTVPIVSNYASK